MRLLRRSRFDRSGTRLFALVLAPLGLGCSETLEPVVCTDQFVYGLIVEGHEGTGGPGAEGATGVAVEGAFADTL